MNTELTEYTLKEFPEIKSHVNEEVYNTQEKANLKSK